MMATMPRLREKYNNEVVPAMRREFGYDNVMQVPRLIKVVVNIGLGEALQNAKALDAATKDLTLISGQKPIVTKAKKSIATFRLRAGNPIGLKVTLRGKRMYDFLDRLFNVAMARVRDFRGISPDSFDGRGSYTLGLKEQTVWPELSFDTVDKVRGMDIVIVTTAKTDDEGAELLRQLGCPLRAQ